MQPNSHSGPLSPSFIHAATQATEHFVVEHGIEEGGSKVFRRCDLGRLYAADAAALSTHAQYEVLQCDIRDRLSKLRAGLTGCYRIYLRTVTPFTTCGFATYTANDDVDILVLQLSHDAVTLSSASM
jgi:hypothetical protein